MKIQLERVGPGHYRHDSYEIDRIHESGERPYWMLVEGRVNGRVNWLNSAYTLREIRQRLIGEILRRERVAGAQS